MLQRNVPAEKELQQPREFYERIAELRARQSEGLGPFSSAEKMIREDRDRYENNRRKTKISGSRTTPALSQSFSRCSGFWRACGLPQEHFLNPDEALHFRLANQLSLALAYKASLTAVHPPLLILLLYFWRALGTSELWLRLPSVLAGTAFCWVFYKWLTKAAGGLAGLIGLLFAALLLPIITLAAEVRQYPLLLAFLISALYFLDEAFAKNSARRMAFFALCLYLAMLFHYSAFLFAAALGIYALFRIFTERPPAKLAAAWAASQVGGLALAVFLYKTHLSKLGAGDSRTPLQGWMSYLQRSYFDPARDNPVKFLVTHSFGVFQYFFGQLAVGDVVGIAFLVGVALLLRGKRLPLGVETQKDRASSRRLGLFLLLPFAVAGAVSLARALSLRRHAPRCIPDYPRGGGRQRNHCVFGGRQMESRACHSRPHTLKLPSLWQTASAQDEPRRPKPQAHGRGPRFCAREH